MSVPINRDCDYIFNDLGEMLASGILFCFIRKYVNCIFLSPDNRAYKNKTIRHSSLSSFSLFSFPTLLLTHSSTVGVSLPDN